MLVEDHEIEARYEELVNTDPGMIAPAYKISLMILSVLSDIRKLLQPQEIKLAMEAENGNGTDELEHQG